MRRLLLVLGGVLAGAVLFVIVSAWWTDRCLKQGQAQVPTDEYFWGDDDLGDFENVVKLVQMSRMAELLSGDEWSDEQQRAEAAREAWTEDEQERIDMAREILARDEVERTPFVVFAQVQEIDAEIMLDILWMDGDGDARGIVVEEVSAHGAVITERYPLFRCLPVGIWNSAFMTPPVLTAHLANTRYELLDVPANELRGRILEEGPCVALRIRSDGQRMDRDEWAGYLDVPVDGRAGMMPPTMWFSLPDETRVRIAVYDQAGNTSDFVPLTLVGQIRPSP